LLLQDKWKNERLQI